MLSFSNLIGNFYLFSLLKNGLVNPCSLSFIELARTRIVIGLLFLIMSSQCHRDVSAKNEHFYEYF